MALKILGRVLILNYAEKFVLRALNHRVQTECERVFNQLHPIEEVPMHIYIEVSYIGGIGLTRSFKMHQTKGTI